MHFVHEWGVSSLKSRCVTLIVILLFRLSAGDRADDVSSLRCLHDFLTNLFHLFSVDLNLFKLQSVKLKITVWTHSLPHVCTFCCHR